MSDTTQKPTPFASILDEHIVAAKSDHVKTADDLMTLILDVQSHDKLKFDETVASCLILGAVTRARSIKAQAAVKDAKDKATRLAKYNEAILRDPRIALDPKANATLQLAHGLIDRQQYDAVMTALNGAVASIETKKVATAK